MKQSNLPWLKLNISVPYTAMLDEAVKLKTRFVAHRDNDIKGGYKHKGWKSLCIHGIDSYKTNHYTQYGYKSHEETPYQWTEVSKLCPVTTNYFKTEFPIIKYYRVRFMLLEPNGYIFPHTDSNTQGLGPINIALSQPDNCIFKMKNKGIVPFKAGEAYLLDVSNKHAVANISNEDRYHIIVHGILNTDKWKELVINSYDISRHT